MNRKEMVDEIKAVGKQVNELLAKYPTIKIIGYDHSQKKPFGFSINLYALEEHQKLKDQAERV